MNEKEKELQEYEMRLFRQFMDPLGDSQNDRIMKYEN